MHVGFLGFSQYSKIQIIENLVTFKKTEVSRESSVHTYLSQLLILRFHIPRRDDIDSGFQDVFDDDLP